MSMRVYNRELNEIIEEKESSTKLVEFLYNTLIGRITLKCMVARPWFSKTRSLYFKSPFSRVDVVPFITKNGVDISDWEGVKFKSFNDFFTRKKEFDIDEGLISVADSKLSVYKIEDAELRIKNSIYTIEELIGGKIENFENGYCLVFRLSLSDYHRYCYIDNGEIVSQKYIKGLLHTVRPISEKYRVYSRNCRVVNVLNTESLGEIVQIEVGATLVGCIRNNKDKEFIKGSEKGYFEFGGSTIVVLLKDNVEIDIDILENSKNGIETKVSIGEKIGIIK